MIPLLARAADEWQAMADAAVNPVQAEYRARLLGRVEGVRWAISELVAAHRSGLVRLEEEESH